MDFEPAWQARLLGKRVQNRVRLGVGGFEHDKAVFLHRARLIPKLKPEPEPESLLLPLLLLLQSQGQGSQAKAAGAGAAGAAAGGGGG
jgi:hypothetical protein